MLSSWKKLSYFFIDDHSVFFDLILKFVTDRLVEVHNVKHQQSPCFFFNIIIRIDEITAADGNINIASLSVSSSCTRAEQNNFANTVILSESCNVCNNSVRNIHFVVFIYKTTDLCLLAWQQ